MRTIIWTREEAEAAWRDRHTERNLAMMIPDKLSSVPYCSGGFLVDGRPATVTVCLNESIKQQILTPSGKEAFDRELDRLERQKWGKIPPDPEPVEGRTCAACGGKLVREILNYYFLPGDVIVPADTVDRCLSCGKATNSND